MTNDPDQKNATRMPAIFFGHGSPMLTLTRNGYTEAWRRIGPTLPRPRAILAVSAHWYIPETAVTAMAAPRTIHDFSGFPQELYEVEYRAPGSPELAQRVKDVLAPLDVALDREWGLDHGTWSVLAHVYPEADIPVVQLGIDRGKPPAWHYQLGRRLAPLRDEGVLVIASGNVVHNLRAANWRPGAQPLDWAARFSQRVRELLARGEYQKVIDYPSLGTDAALSVPTPEHYLPLLYIIGLQAEGEAITFPVEGIDLGSIDMLSVAVGMGEPKAKSD